MKLKTYISLLFLLVGLGLVSCRVPQQEEMDIEPVRMAIEAANLKFIDAVRNGDAAALAILYAEDATILAPDMDIIQGRPAIEAFWAGVLQLGLKNVVLTTVAVKAGGDFTYEIGKAVSTIQLEGQEPMEQNGKYVAIWKKTVDGTWKMYVDIWNNSPRGDVL